MNRPLLEARRLSKIYALGGNRLTALSDVSLRIFPGEMVAVTGASGSGKSTLLNLMGCLDRPSSGEYWFMGERVNGLPSDRLAEIRNRRIGFVFQAFNLLPRATALENVALPLIYAGVPKRRRDRVARAALEQLGLGDWTAHRPNQLSGGQQQRVAIARALVTRPALILADEPTGSVESRTGREIIDLLQRLNRDGMTVVIVTHDPQVARQARRLLQIADGRLTSDLASQPSGRTLPGAATDIGPRP